MTSDITPLCFSYLKYYILWSKEPIKDYHFFLVYYFFLDFRVLNSKFVKFFMSVLKWQVNSSSNFALQILRSCFFYFQQKDPIKVPILTFSSALVNVCQISFFKPQVSFSSKFAHLFSVMKDNSSVF